MRNWMQSKYENTRAKPTGGKKDMEKKLDMKKDKRLTKDPGSMLLILYSLIISLFLLIGTLAQTSA